MGLKVFGGPEAPAAANVPAQAAFSASGPSGNQRPRRVWVRFRNKFGANIQTRVAVPFYISNSSLGRSSGVASALASGTMSCSVPIGMTGGGGGVIVTSPGRAGVIVTSTSGRARLNLSQTSLADRNIYLVLQFPDGSRAISSQIRISS